MAFVHKIPGWKYYNHAAVPTTAPHEEPDLTPVRNGSIWNIEGKHPLLVRYTTEWDCGYDTGWWYLIREAPFDISVLSSNSRKHIKEAFRKVKVEKIDPASCIEALYDCYHQAFLKYKQADNEMPFDWFEKSCLMASFNGFEYWGGYSLDSGKLIGYLLIAPHKDWVEILTSKFHPDYLKLRVSDALYATVLEKFLNDFGKKYVSSGSRSINHTTNTQEYKEQHFGYRKCYCKLNLVYSPKMRIAVALLYPLRHIIDLFGRYNRIIHQVSAILKMEEIFRK